MAIKITIPKKKNRVITTANTGSPAVSSAAPITRTLETLSNIDVSEGLADGMTLLYDQATQKWVAREPQDQVDADNNVNLDNLQSSVTNLDGGTY